MPGRTEDEKHKIGGIADDSTKNDYTKINEGKDSGIKKEVETMEEKERMNFGQEYGSSITESLTYRQYLADTAFVLDNFNPVKRVLIFRDEMPDEESKKIIDGFVKSDMPDFLIKCRKASENCLDVGLEISDIAKTLAKKRKEVVR